MASRLTCAAKKIFRFWYKVRDGTWSRARFQNEVVSWQRTLEHYLEKGAASSHPQIAGKYRRIVALKESLWTFVERDVVEPTNNQAERMLRPAVLWRKTSLGTDSEEGSRFVERMLTTVRTLQLQKRSVLRYLTELNQAYLLQQPAPSLLPQSLPSPSLSA